MDFDGLIAVQTGLGMAALIKVHRYVITYTKINYNIGLITMRAAIPNPV
jgi:hypothetical protein